MTFSEFAKARVTPEMKEYIKSKKDGSAYLRDLILRDMNDIAQLEHDIKLTENAIEKHKMDIKDLELILHNQNDRLNRVRSYVNHRPEVYDDTVDTLIGCKLVSERDFVFQAERCKVTVDMYKSWLYQDGVYDKLLGL